ncbi:MAG: dihydrofolate reductase family protein, partial [Chitinophagaceae bacterium]|nr:dihydrofolate reductase family protein [Chitinophagaceae bacterium]
MRKLIVSMNVSLDGYMSGNNSGLEWHFRSWTNDMTGYARKQLSRADTILLGRNTYQTMSGYWPWQPPDNAFSKEDMAYAAMMNNFRKIVFSHSMKSSSWKNTEIVNEDIQRYITGLKKQDGKDIIIFGSHQVIDKIIPLHLVDE